MWFRRNKLTILTLMSHKGCLLLVLILSMIIVLMPSGLKLVSFPAFCELRESIHPPDKSYQPYLRLNGTNKKAFDSRKHLSKELTSQDSVPAPAISILLTDLYYALRKSYLCSLSRIALFYSHRIDPRYPASSRRREQIDVFQSARSLKDETKSCHTHN
jgi:hypothetical protein